MNILDRLYIKIGYRLIGTNIPINIIIGLYLVSKKHIYIDVKTINYKKVFKLLKTFDRVAITGTGVLIIFYKNSIVKYPLGNHSYVALHQEYNNYFLLKKSHLSSIVDYFLEKEDEYYVMEKLFDLKYPVREHKKICFQLSKIKTKNIALSELLESKVFSNALEYIGFECSNFSIEDILTILKAEKIIKSYPMHGDLTQYNIMKNKKDHIVLIDLDRFSFGGMENIDRIHFVVEYYANKRKIDFFQIIEDIINNKDISEKYFYFLLLYFIYRVGVEYDNNIILPTEYHSSLCCVIDIFLKKELKL